MTNFSCRFCVAPKRYPGCHSKCPEYLAERAKYDELKAENDKKKVVEGELISQRMASAYKIMKKYR